MAGDQGEQPPVRPSWSPRSAGSAAAAASRVPISSLTLLQGAFSHFAFAREYGRGREGAFRGVVTRGQLAGPVVITHTHNDRAVRTAYALASRVARQTGAGIGDRSDPYGGIGANGAVATDEADDSVALLDVGGEYRFLTGRVHNLRADRFVAGHSSVSGRQVAHALAAAITS